MTGDIFDRRARAKAHARASRADNWLVAIMAEEIVARLGAVTPVLRQALIVGIAHPVLTAAFAERGIGWRHHACATPADIVAEEDRLDVEPGSCDLIVALGTLGTVNDLPQALLRMRLALKPNGLFFAAFPGAGSLPTLRRCFDSGAARLHPLIELRSLGDLFTRAGLSQVVSDTDTIAARYGSLPGLMSDLAAVGMGNQLSQRRPFRPGEHAAAAATFTAMADPDGRTTERFALLYASGWAPVGGEARPQGPVRGVAQAPQ